MSDTPPEAGKPAPVLAPEPLIGALTSREVEFVVVGGFAVAAHGHVRATKDIDICPDPSEPNIKKLADALAAIGAVPIGLDELDGEFDLKPDFEGLSSGGNWTLDTRYGRLDILQTFTYPGADDDLGGYAELIGSAVWRDFLGHEVKFCGFADLLRMKEGAGRPLDRTDVENLKAARRQA